jgi:hypothetical protein
VGHNDHVVIEVFGEGKTDVGDDSGQRLPDRGVVPILLHTLCGKPERMRAKCRNLPHLQGRTLSQKMRFAKRQASYNGSAAAVFVVDSEGGHAELKRKRQSLDQGRETSTLPLPVAIGVAHPCIEAWLLSDPTAIRRALELPSTPVVPDEPESLPAPCMDPRGNPKRVLADVAGLKRDDLPARAKCAIAQALNDVTLVRTRCPLGFSPFADEVERHIKPLFAESTA